MSDEGEKTCPLCAEEMDLTDQQLKPCKCGYEICVWCWHHIMDMAEKDDTEGRCPACRVPYDKEKIVGMAASCEKVVTAGKTKSQKTKTKSSEGRKQLSSVRVIQRNLVYIVGLPLNLADEDLLQRKEYFGQYGKVLKVSMSRTAAGVIQQFPNNTCSVYITYGKEEEAVRCIQSVHGFILDGRSLRACFGTTKYCHAWLRNVPCNNPDCLYLHEIGSQEDSYTKDEIISAYTRSRVQQITGATLNMQRRSGNVLPAPTDDFCISSPATTGRPIVKNASNNSVSIVKGSPPNSSSGRSPALPAAASWGMRASNCQTPAASSACSKDPSKPKLDTFSGSLAYSSAVANSIQAVDLQHTPRPRGWGTPMSQHPAPPRPAPLCKQQSWSPDTYRDEAWLRRKKHNSKRRSKSVTDEDLDELKACIELGFGFDSPSPEVDQRLSDTLPALDFYHAVNKKYYDTVSKWSSSSSSTSSMVSECETPSPTGSPATIFGPGDNPQMVKTRLKQWAQVVACSVRQSSSCC